MKHGKRVRDVPMHLSVVIFEQRVFIPAVSYRHGCIVLTKAYFRQMQLALSKNAASLLIANITY